MLPESWKPGAETGQSGMESVHNEIKWIKIEATCFEEYAEFVNFAFYLKQTEASSCFIPPLIIEEITITYRIWNITIAKSNNAGSSIGATTRFIVPRKSPD